MSNDSEDKLTKLAVDTLINEGKLFVKKRKREFQATQLKTYTLNKCYLNNLLKHNQSHNKRLTYTGKGIRSTSPDKTARRNEDGPVMKLQDNTVESERNANHRSSNVNRYRERYDSQRSHSTSCDTNASNKENRSRNKHDRNNSTKYDDDRIEQVDDDDEEHPTYYEPCSSRRDKIVEKVNSVNTELTHGQEHLSKKRGSSRDTSSRCKYSRNGQTKGRVDTRGESGEKNNNQSRYETGLSVLPCNVGKRNSYTEESCEKLGYYNYRRTDDPGTRSSDDSDVLLLQGSPIVEKVEARRSGMCIIDDDKFDNSKVRASEVPSDKISVVTISDESDDSFLKARKKQHKKKKKKKHSKRKDK